MELKNTTKQGIQLKAAITFSLCLFFSCLVVGQKKSKFLQVKAYHEEKIEVFCDSLKNSGIEKFIVYEKGCRGCWIKYQFDYDTSRPHYIFWQEQNGWVVKKIDHYTEYKKVELDEFSYFDHFLKHKTIMEKEVLFTRHTGSYEVDSITGDTLSELVKLFGSHSSYNRLTFYDSIDTFEIYFQPDYGDFGATTKKYEMILNFDRLVSSLESRKKMKSKNFNYYPPKIQREWKKRIKENEKNNQNE